MPGPPPPTPTTVSAAAHLLPSPDQRRDTVNHLTALSGAGAPGRVPAHPPPTPPPVPTLGTARCAKRPMVPTEMSRPWAAWWPRLGWTASVKCIWKATDLLNSSLEKVLAGEPQTLRGKWTARNTEILPKAP